MPELYLASQSPRRAELLAQLGYKFKTIVPNVNETPLVGESAIDLATRLAHLKAEAGLAMIGVPTSSVRVIGSDTVVALGDTILGKPKNRDDFMDMFALLSGSSHWVHTGLCVCSTHTVKLVCSSSKVVFRDISAQEAAAYWASGEPCDKAGGYGIQGLAAKFIKHIEGSYSSVMGLPLFELDQALAQF